MALYLRAESTSPDHLRALLLLFPPKPKVIAAIVIKVAITLAATAAAATLAFALVLSHHPC